MSKKRKKARKKKKLPQSRKLLLPLTESPLNIITEERLKQMDALIGRLQPQDETGLEPLEPVVLQPILPAVVAELKRSHSDVDRVYELEHDLETLEAGGEASDGLRSLTRDRYRASVLFTASLILTAWRESADLRIPDWGLPEQPPKD